MRSESRVWWLHPFLVAAFPVLFLFARNVGEQLSFAPLWPPLGTVLAAAAAGVLVAWLVGRVRGVGATRAALWVSLLILLALTYGHAWNAVGDTLRLHRYLLGVWGSLALAGLLGVALLPRTAAVRLTAGLTVMAALLVVINVIPMWQLVGRDAALRSSVDDLPVTEPLAPAGTRDVWYLVFDRYAGSAGLEGTYGFDNSAFLDALRERGFSVADRATANYLKTAMSLVSSLNMEELAVPELAAEATAADDWTPVLRRMQAPHEVGAFLQRRGYAYLHVGSRLGDTLLNAAADETFVFTDTTEFSAALVDTTILAALEHVLPRQVPRGSTPYVPDQSLAQLDRLHAAADDPGLDFVFAHLLLPHPPYVFNADGTRVTDAQRDGRTIDEQYLEQLRFTNAEILELVDRLQSAAPADEPIIVLAADEGPFPERYRRNEDDFRWVVDARADELLRKFSILTAVSVPGADEEALEAAGFHDALTSVNLLRVVFNAAFDAGLPLLPERNWVFVDQHHLYEMVDVTDRVQAELRASAATLR